MSSITYKPGTDIVEESQQLALCIYLLNNGYRVLIEPPNHIPQSTMKQLQSYGDLCVFQSRYDIDTAGISIYEVDIK
jgi:hypothetical protein